MIRLNHTHLVHIMGWLENAVICKYKCSLQMAISMIARNLQWTEKQCMAIVIYVGVKEY